MKLFHKECQGALGLGRYQLTASVQERKTKRKNKEEKRTKGNHSTQMVAGILGEI